MSANEIHVGDVGTLFKINVKDGAAIVSLTGTTSKQIVFKRPDATTYTGNLSFYTNGSDGIVTFLITSGLLNQQGVFQFQVVYTNAAGTWHSDLVSFDVWPNLI